MDPASIAMIASAGASMGMSISQALKQNKLRKEAESKAAEMMDMARKRLEVNVYDAIGIKKEPYELEREALIAAGAQAIEAGRESQRGAASTAGQVQMAQTESQAGVRTAMGQEMLDLEKLAAQEQSRLRDAGVQIDLMEAQGAQMAAAQAEDASRMATTQAVESAMAGVQAGIRGADLYGKSKSLRELNKFTSDYAKSNNLTNEQAMSQIQKNVGSLGSYNNIPLQQVANMTPVQFEGYLGSLDPQALQGILNQIGMSTQQTNSAYSSYNTDISQNFYKNELGLDPFNDYRNPVKF